jgi:hypothetical protein
MMQRLICCLIEQEEGVRGCACARGEDRDRSRPSGSPGIARFVRGCSQRSGAPTKNYFVLEALRSGKERRGEGGVLGPFIGGRFRGRGARVYRVRQDRTDEAHLWSPRTSA